jgi:tetratricopeptide (TPR) repeat protein
LAEQLSAAEHDALETHVEACERCQKTLARLSDEGQAFDGRYLRASRPPAVSESVRDFVRLLKESPPAAGDEATPKDEAGAAAIRFPGPPTSKGPLGQLDSFHIRKQLGAGKFGIVYQAYDALDRLVAIKILKPELAASPRERARLEEEARRAAAVKHDHVVIIHQVGSTRGFSLPYLVMEYIDGESLSDRLKRQGVLEPRAAARIVQQVARGLAAAHEQGLVHRDIKPSNIMLEKASDRAKITDFGLARVIEEGGETSSGSERIVGTPAYMSPEQISTPGRLDPRTDVYSLGVVLYELLTGERPFRGVPHMLLQQVVHEEPRSPRKLNDRIPRDVETITLSCLANEPGRRYQTAQALADDLQRWLDGKAIQARPVGMAGKVWRWCRRKPALAGLTAALLLALVCGVAGVTWQWRRAEANYQRERAQWQRAEASYQVACESFAECVRKIVDDPRLKSGPLEDLRRVVLQAELLFYQKFVDLQGDSPDFQAERARAFMRLGYITQNLDSKERALDPYQQAQAILTDLVRDHPDNRRYRADLALCYNNLGYLYQVLGQPEKAQQADQNSLALRKGLVRDDPADPQYQFNLVQSYLNLGDFFQRDGRPQEGIQAFREAMPLVTALARDHPTVADYQTYLAKFHHNLAVLYYNVGANDPQWHAREVKEAERGFREAWTIWQRLAKKHPSRTEYQVELARCQRNLGSLYRLTGRPQEAKEAFDQALALWEMLSKRHPLVPEYQSMLVGCYHNLAGIYQDSSAQQAEDALGKALVGQQRLARDHPGDIEFALALGTTQCDLGNLTHNTGRFEVALEWFDQAVAQLQTIRARQPRHVTVRRYLYNAREGRAKTLTEVGQHTEALAEWERALELADESHRPWARLQRALTLARLGDYGQAITEVEALAPVKDPPAEALCGWACVYALAAPAAQAAGKPAGPYADRAMELLRRAVAAGYHKVEELKKESDFNSLRSREDFQKLLSELEKKAQAEVKTPVTKADPDSHP